MKRGQSEGADVRDSPGISPGVIAGAYWASATVTFVLNFDFGVLAVLPWSYIIMYFQMPLPAGHPFVDFLNRRLGGLLMFPGLCGGLNTALLYGLLSVVDWKRLLRKIGESNISAVACFTI